MIESEVSLFINGKEENITSYLVECIKKLQDHDNILYFSYFYSKEFLLSKYEDLNKKNITIVNDTSIMFDGIEKYILEYKPKYVFVDYLKMTRRCNFYVQGKRLHYVRETIERLEDKYNINILAVINLLEDK